MAQKTTPHEKAYQYLWQELSLATMKEIPDSVLTGRGIRLKVENTLLRRANLVIYSEYQDRPPTVILYQGSLLNLSDDLQVPFNLIRMTAILHELCHYLVFHPTAASNQYQDIPFKKISLREEEQIITRVLTDWIQKHYSEYNTLVRMMIGEL